MCIYICLCVANTTPYSLLCGSSSTRVIIRVVMQRMQSLLSTKEQNSRVSRTLNNTLNIETLKNTFFCSLSRESVRQRFTFDLRETHQVTLLIHAHLHTHTLTDTQRFLYILFFVFCVCVSVHERESSFLGAFFNTLYTSRVGLWPRRGEATKTRRWSRR
jgi:UDP-2,3-diacylglucosamine pyrophosphatase LpxH